MPPNMCLPQIQACGMRIADLDTDGVPLPGSDNLLGSGALVKVTITPVYVDGTDIVDKNGCGEMCVNFKGEPSFRRGDVSIEICTHDPYVMAKLSSSETISYTEPGHGLAVGSAAPPIGPITSNGISLELWRKRVDDGDLDLDFPYAWWALPKLVNLRPGPSEASDGNPHPTFTAEAIENPNWFDGPLNDWPATSDRAWQWIPTRTLPDFVCGPVALVGS